MRLRKHMRLQFVRVRVLNDKVVNRFIPIIIYVMQYNEYEIGWLMIVRFPEGQVIYVVISGLNHSLSLWVIQCDSTRRERVPQRRQRPFIKSCIPRIPIQIHNDVSITVVKSEFRMVGFRVPYYRVLCWWALHTQFTDSHVSAFWSPEVRMESISIGK